MKTLLLLLWLLPVLAVAQGVVNVNNRGLSSIQLVLDAEGRPLVGTNYVAQIVYGPNSQSLTNELGPVMPFRVPTTTSPGTWNPLSGSGVRMLNGFPPGQVAWMLVRVWDKTVFSTWGEVADYIESNGNRPLPVGVTGVVWGQSQAFTMVAGGSTPSSQLMENFMGFQCQIIRPAVVLLADRVRQIPENSPPLFIPIETLLPDSGGREVIHAPPSMVLGTYTFIPSGDRGFEIRVPPDSIGTVARVGISGILPWFPGSGTPEYYLWLEIVAIPSPRRPFLDFALTNSRPSLTLRGLPPRSYRIEGSTNLTGWTRLGELSMGEDGNAPVPDAWLATNATQFVRFVPLPP